MAKTKKGVGRGWHGDPERHAAAGKKGGETTAERHGPDFYEKIGEKGGEKSSGKFKKGDKRAVEAGKRGGSQRRSRSE